MFTAPEAGARLGPVPATISMLRSVSVDTTAASGSIGCRILLISSALMNSSGKTRSPAPSANSPLVPTRMPPAATAATPGFLVTR